MAVVKPVCGLTWSASAEVRSTTLLLQHTSPRAFCWKRLLGCANSDTKRNTLPSESEAIWDTIGSSQPPRRGEPQMQYRQITSGERYAIAALRRQGLSLRAIARDLGRAPSTISRELARNRSSQGGYTPTKADSYAHARRRRARRGSHFSAEEWALVEELLALDWSPEQVAGWLARHGLLADQLRDHLPARLARQARRRRALDATCVRRASGAASATAPTTPRKTRRQAPHLGAAAGGRGAPDARPLGDRHGEGQRPGAPQRRHHGRARDRLPCGRQADPAHAPPRRTGARSS